MAHYLGSEKGYCIHMGQRYVLGKHPYDGPNNPVELGCELTREKCVASRQRLFGMISDKLDIKTLERCPSRKTVEQIINEKAQEIPNIKAVE